MNLQLQMTALCSALLLTMGPAPGHATVAVTAEQDAAAKINLSGRQRMLSQRIAKAACFANMNIDRDAHLKMLNDARGLYATTLDGLAAGDPSQSMLPETDPTVSAELEKVRTLWQEYDEVLEAASESSDQEMLLVVMEYSVPVLKQSNAVVKALVASRGGGSLDPKLAQTIDVAGRQRMLSQRISKAFCAMEIGALPASAADELSEAINLFEDSHAALKQGSDAVVAPPSAEIAAQLDVVEGIWAEIRPFVLASASGVPVSMDGIATVADRNNDLLREMNKAVGMYQRGSSK